MPLSAAPLACYEFNNSGIDAAGTGPTLAGGTYSANSPLFGTHSLNGYAAKSSPIGNLATLPNGSHSISMWIRNPITEEGSGAMVYVSSGTRVTSLNVGNESYYPNLEIRCGNSSVYVDTGVASSTTWRLAVVTWDGTTSKLYLDAVLKATIALNASRADAGPAEVVANSDVYDSERNIKQLAFFDTALTADDIAYLYNSGNGRAYADWEIAEAEETGNPFIENIQRFQLLT